MLNLECRGFPEDRRQRLLRHLLQDRQQVMRYLFLLLGEEAALSLSDVTGSSRHGNGSASASEGYHADLPMLEALVKALEHSPEKLDHVERLVSELSSTEEGQALLPKDFDQIWKPLWQARTELAKNGR
jgi:hypothetical protein